jgi:NADH dehydrogenase
MATVGKHKAVVDLPFVKFKGYFAWFVWMFVHLLALVGFRNKVVTFLNWAYNYVKYDKGIRLIIRPVKSKLEEKSDYVQ